VGVALFAAAAGWVAVTGIVAGAAAGPVVGLLVATGLAWGACRVFGERSPAALLTGVVGAALAVAASDLGATLRTGPLQGPFGYANASGAFFAQAALAGVMLTVCARARALRLAGGTAAAVFAGLVVLSGSWAAVILLLVLVPLAVLLGRSRGARTAVAVLGATFAVALLSTIVIAALRIGTGPGLAERAIGVAISDRRVELWHDALVLTSSDPLLGVGPGRFSIESPIAASDPDARWAHHEFLQLAAETGLPGFALLVGLFAWGFASLWAAGSGRLIALGAAGLAMVGIHACIDYVLHFPAVPLAAVAVFGAALGARRGEPVVAPPIPGPVSVEVPA
jgi:hypothetical protein